MTEQHINTLEQLATAALQSGVIRDLASAVAVHDAIEAVRAGYLRLNLPVTGQPVSYNGNKEKSREESGNKKSGA